MNKEAERKMLKRIRQAVDEAPTDWKIVSDGERLTLTASPPAFENMGEGMSERDDPFPSPYAVLDSKDMPAAMFLAYAHGDITFLLSMWDRAVSAFKQQPTHQTGRQPALPPGSHPAPKIEQQKNYASHCAMACGKEPFQKFLAQRFELSGDLPDKNEIAHLIRHALGINSRAELNAAGAWLALNHEYQQWLNQPMDDGR